MAAHTRATLAVVALLVLPGVLAGCTADRPSRGASSAATSGTDAGTSLTRCLRDAGYDIEDPASGGGPARATIPDGVDPDQFAAAEAACIEAAGGDLGAGEGARPAPGSDDLARRSAECIRDHGYPDYPDDEAGQRAWHDPSDAFEDVATTCSDEVVGDLGDRGERVG